MTQMPTLRPVPIVTDGQSLLRRLWGEVAGFRKWVLVEDFDASLPDGQAIHIPAGFVFNGPSIPRPIWSLLGIAVLFILLGLCVLPLPVAAAMAAPLVVMATISPVGILLVPSLIHDFGYQFGELRNRNGDPIPGYNSRSAVDMVFFGLAVHYNRAVTIALLAYIALLLFGWIAWNSCRNKE